ncbi:tumor necrosis factor receptor superfamily member 9 [Cyclopterus lumpus]|uniref:TNFR-Cys domain-containing protein n=1 Tax=Cyclopterus lumpus TaxID=8103 RepID=A0A8C3ASM0_CYCLU|nr:tumor necrosis factor receptor superfamily member 9 [Cyclopterus lumpus]
MVLFKVLVFTLTFHKIIVDLDARTICPKGHRVTKSGTSCEICPSEAFQPEEKDSQFCKACTKCDFESGSIVKEECTKETNTKCQCRGEFVPWESDSSTCRCGIGFGLKRDGTECSKCEDGYFSTQINSCCQKWRECKCGVKMNGTRSSDVLCNFELQGCSGASNTYITPPSNTYIITATTSNKLVSLITRLTSHHSNERAQTQRMDTIATTAAPGHTDAYIATGVAFLILGIIGLLVLTAVIGKLHMTPQPIALKNDSLCRRPVEESGEGSLSSLKLNPGEH